jgi:hypothetical protein
MYKKIFFKKIEVVFITKAGTIGFETVDTYVELVVRTK